MCLCAREIVVICFSFWPVKIWQFAELGASWQMMIFLLKKRVCKWKQTSSPAGCSKCYQTSCEKCSQMLDVNTSCVCSGADQLVDSQAIWLLFLHVYCFSNLTGEMLTAVLCFFFLSSGLLLWPLTVYSVCQQAFLISVSLLPCPSGNYCWREQESAAPERRGSR